MTDSNQCIKRYIITRDKSPWSGFTSTYEDEERSGKIPAVKLEGSGYKPLPYLESYKVNGNAVIARDEKLRRVAVDESLFSDLLRGDATKKSDEKFSLGKYRDLKFRAFSPERLAEFLIESQIVNTYWHVEADLCLVSQDKTPQLYTAHYRGKHIYFTNSENEEPLDFTITINKMSGEIFLEVK